MRDFRYDVAISFAGEQRPEAEAIAACLSKANVSVFYDAYEQSNLWGKNLYDHLADVYNNRARYCLMLVSAAYAAKVWTNHERKNAQARALSEKDEYILPVRFDDTDIPGLPETVGYLRFQDHGVEGVCRLLLEKLNISAKAASTAPPKTATFPEKHKANEPAQPLDPDLQLLAAGELEYGHLKELIRTAERRQLQAIKEIRDHAERMPQSENRGKFTLFAMGSYEREVLKLYNDTYKERLIPIRKALVLQVPSAAYPRADYEAPMPPFHDLQEDLGSLLDAYRSKLRQMGKSNEPVQFNADGASSEKEVGAASPAMPNNNVPWPSFLDILLGALIGIGWGTLSLPTNNWLSGAVWLLAGAVAMRKPIRAGLRARSMAVRVCVALLLISEIGLSVMAYRNLQPEVLSEQAAASAVTITPAEPSESGKDKAASVTPPSPPASERTAQTQVPRPDDKDKAAAVTVPPKDLPCTTNNLSDVTNARLKQCALEFAATVRRIADEHDSEMTRILLQQRQENIRLTSGKSKDEILQMYAEGKLPDINSTALWHQATGDGGQRIESDLLLLREELEKRVPINRRPGRPQSRSAYVAAARGNTTKLRDVISHLEMMAGNLPK